MKKVWTIGRCRRHGAMALLLALLLALPAACTDVTQEAGQEDGNFILRPGESLVNFSLTGLAGGGAAEVRAASAVPAGAALRAGNESLTLKGECEVKRLYIFCYTSWNGTGEETETENFVLERIYTYIEKGNENDILLVPEANGYRAGIGVPRDDNHKRAFLLVANVDPNWGGGFQLPTIGDTYANAVLNCIMSVGSNNIISPPLPMSAAATHRVVSPEGVIRDDSVFIAGDMERGMRAKLVRLVSRIDIDNPDVSGFSVTGIQVTAASDTKVFFPESDYWQTHEYPEISLTNATEIPGACYLFPLIDDGSTDPVKVTLTGVLLGTPGQKLTAEAPMRRNTRYVVRVRNDEANVRISIEVADWNDGSTLDTDDVSKKLNTECTVTAVNDKVTVDEYERLIRLVDGTLESNEVVKLTGATGDGAPIGIVLPEDCDWLAVGTPGVDTDGTTYTVSLVLPQYPKSGGGATTRGQIGGGGSDGKGTVYPDPLLRPLRVPVSFAYQKDGKTCYQEYTVLADIPGASLEVTGEQRYPKNPCIVLDSGPSSLGSVDEATHTVRLPGVAGVGFHVRGTVKDENNLDKEIGNPAYIAADCSWFARGGEKAAIYDNSYMTLGQNTTGAPRQTTLMVRSYGEGYGDEPPYDDIPWTVIQEPGIDDSRLADDAEVRLPLRRADWLAMTGNVIERAGVEIELVGDFNKISLKATQQEVENANRRGIYSDFLRAGVNRLLTTFNDQNPSEYEKEAMLIDQLAYISAKGGKPLYVTTDVHWIHVTYCDDNDVGIDVLISTAVYLSLPDKTPQPKRTGHFTIHLANGQERTYTVNQAETIVEYSTTE